MTEDHFESFQSSIFGPSLNWLIIFSFIIPNTLPSVTKDISMIFSPIRADVFSKYSFNFVSFFFAN